MLKFKTCAVAAMVVAASSISANAADLDRAIGLIVAGEVEKAAGVQIFDIPSAGPLDGGTETAFWSGTSAKLSLPLGENLSIQNDFDIEYNDQAFDSSPGEAGLLYGFQGAVHLSWRNPEQALFGAFGGIGTTHYFHRFGAAPDPGSLDQDFRFVGGEAQLYLDNITLYAQGGYVDVAEARPGFGRRPDDGLFARGVGRWFLDADTRLQFEGTYASLDRNRASRDIDIFSWGARYDTRLALPIVGDSGVFLGYRGTYRDDCFQFAGGQDLTDHTIMVGFSYQFGGTSMLDNDRRGATLDTPDFANMLTCGGPPREPGQNVN